MTTHARLYAQHDGTCTLTIGERTETIEATDLNAGLEQLLARVVDEAHALGETVDVVAQIEGNPRTGLRVNPDGEITEDPRVLIRSLSRTTATEPHTDRPETARPTARTGRRHAKKAASQASAAVPNGAAARPSDPQEPALAQAQRRSGRAGLVAALVAVAVLAGTGLWAAFAGGDESPAAAQPTEKPNPTATPTPTPEPNTPTPTPSTPAPVRLKVRTVGGPEVIGFAITTDARTRVQVRVWPKGAPKQARQRAIQVRQNARLTLRGLAPGRWRWTVDTIPTAAQDPARGSVRVAQIPTPATTPTVSPSPVPVPTATATATPTTTPTTAAPVPTKPPAPQPTRPPTKQPTKKPGGPGPGGDGPVDPGDGGPIDPG